MLDILPISPDHEEYLRDESRLSGSAGTISFPENDEDIAYVLRKMSTENIPVTIQGSRTGLSGGAVPSCGHVINLKKMNSIIDIHPAKTPNSCYITVMPGLLLCSLRDHIQNSSFASYFFPPDPTEDTASIGGIAACNSSGASSYFYGPARKYIHGLKVVLSDGSILRLQRNHQKASGRNFELFTDDMRSIKGSLPGYSMPKVKNSAGYYAKDNMDLIDLFIGSEGTLGVISQIQLLLLPKPKHTWGLMLIADDETNAADLVINLRERQTPVISIEYFDQTSMSYVRDHVPCRKNACGLYVEFSGNDENELTNIMLDIAAIADEHGIDEQDIFTACDDKHIKLLKDARHAVPEGINSLIDQTRIEHPNVTKLGSDIAVPNNRLKDMLHIYSSDLTESDLVYAVFGHIGNNHLHVNILARDENEYARGKALFLSWAKKAISFGGTISAEHGTGKLKKEYLKLMYNSEDIDGMKRLKMLFDKNIILGRGNMF